MIGGFLPLLGAGHRVGKGDTIILESCEYCNSFLNFFPTAAVILDVDADHLDFFKDLQDVERSFRKFASLVPADGLIVANGDDKNTRDTLAGMPYLSFGFDAKNDVYGKNFSEDFSEFDVFCGGQPYAHLHLGVIGRHNALNALGRLRGGMEIRHFPAKPQPRRSQSSTARAAGSNTRATSTAQTSTTTMPTIPTSSTRFCRLSG